MAFTTDELLVAMGPAQARSRPASTVRGLIGLGTMAQQNASAVAITGGTIDTTPVGATTPRAGSFTDLTGTERVFLTGVLTPTQITSNQTDYNPTGLSTCITLRLDTDASRNLFSLAGGSAGRAILLHNVGANALVVKDDDGATGTASMRFALAEDVTLAGDESMLIQYDATSSRWRCAARGTASTSASTSDANVYIWGALM